MCAAEVRKPRVSFAEEEEHPEFLPVESTPSPQRNVSFGQSPPTISSQHLVIL